MDTVLVFLISLIYEGDLYKVLVVGEKDKFYDMIKASAL